MKNLIFTIAKTLGCKYLLNIASGEVHRLDSITGNCFIYRIRFWKLIWFTAGVRRLQHNDPDINGCMWCNKEMDTDI